MRRSNLIALLAVMVVVAGCTKKPAETAALVTDADMAATQQTAPTTPVDGMTAGAIVPGSEQDLVTNVGDRVFFGYDQYDLSGEARAQIEKQAQWMKTYATVNVMVEGHCDERGTREYNLALGEKRAAAVRNYLIALGVDGGRVQTISYGKERPAVMGADDMSWAQNRRGVLVVQ